MTKPKIDNNAKIAKRWNYAVLGADVDDLDRWVSLDGKHCTRAKFVRDAIAEKGARTDAEAGERKALVAKEVAQVHQTLVKEGLVDEDLSHLGITPGGVATNPFPDSEEG